MKEKDDLAKICIVIGYVQDAKGNETAGDKIENESNTTAAAAATLAGFTGCGRLSCLVR